jgi:hypothetical protein
MLASSDALTVQAAPVGSATLTAVFIGDLSTRADAQMPLLPPFHDGNTGSIPIGRATVRYFAIGVLRLFPPTPGENGANLCDPIMSCGDGLGFILPNPFP